MIVFKKIPGSGGHYTSFFRSPHQNQWFHANDSKVGKHFVVANTCTAIITPWNEYQDFHKTGPFTVSYSKIGCRDTCPVCYSYLTTALLNILHECPACKLFGPELWFCPYLGFGAISGRFMVVYGRFRPFPVTWAMGTSSDQCVQNQLETFENSSGFPLRQPTVGLCCSDSTSH